MADTQLDCPICKDTFKDPKIIPCYHSFCCKCLEDYVSRNLRKGIFICPMCRKSVALPAGGVSAFQTNFYLAGDENKDRRRLFCDQHIEEEIKLFCQDCNTLICALCISIRHVRHNIKHVSEASADVKRNLQIKIDKCSDKVKRLTKSESEAEALDRKINESEKKEIKALEDQRVKLITLIDEEISKMKNKIQAVYGDLRQQNASFKKDLKEQLKTCSTANDNARHIIDRGTDIDIIKKVLDIEKLLSKAMGENVTKTMTRMDTELFTPVKVGVEDLIPLIGTMGDSTELSLQSNNKQLVAAIDFGTTYSGWAFSCKHEYDADPTNIFVRQWLGGITISLKAPTAVLIKPDGETFDSFGYDAEDKYAELVCEDQHKAWYYYRRFKMMLHGRTFNRDMKLEDETGKTMHAMKVLSLVIRYLMTDLIKTNNDRLAIGQVTNDDILWIFTVPAIWSDAAKQFMREAAIKAGIEERNLGLASEPETASILGLSNFKTGSKYMVLDAGGETVNLTVHEMMSGGKLKEIHKATGGAWGGTQVDGAFKQFIISLVGPNVFLHFTNETPDDYLYLLRHFEKKKRDISPESDTRVAILCPASLIDIFHKETGKDLGTSIRETKYADKVFMSCDKLSVDVSLMKSFFSDVIQSIVSHVKLLIKDCQVQDISSILMVGGFSECKILQNAIKSNFPNLRVVIPQDAGVVVLKGAVVFGQQANDLIKRKHYDD